MNMFKKVEIWILYLFILLSLFFSGTFALFFGILVRQELVGKTKLGKVSETALFFAEIPLYLRDFFLNPHRVLDDRFPMLEGFNGNPNIEESYLLLSKYDGDLKEGIVQLIDLRNFNTIHTWNPDINEINKSINKSAEFRNIPIDQNNFRALIKNPIITKNGELFFGDNTQFRKIDKCSKLVFQKGKDVLHHSKEEDFDGNIWSPAYLFPQSLPVEKVGRKTSWRGYLDDGIVQMTPDGEIIFEKSVSDILIENGFENLLFTSKEINRFNKDPIHLNDIQPVKSDGPFWQRGDLFLSLRHQSMILLYRPSTNKIIWQATGPFFHQHDVNIINNHSISIFNNNSKMFFGGDVVDGYNEILIFDFRNNNFKSYLRDSMYKEEVKTITQGRGTIISNGDLFVEENNYGRLIYFNSDGSVRWTHVNRANNGKIYGYGWSRILFGNEEVAKIKNFLQKNNECNY